MERPLLGYCRLSATVFDRMTPREAQWRLQAESEREDREFERLAQLACWVMNPWIEKQQDRMSVGKLLKRRVAPAKKDDWLEEWMKD
jgi:hypothetical protein